MSDCALLGTLLHLNEGEMPEPSHVKSFGKFPLLTKFGLVNVKLLVIAELDTFEVTTFLRRTVLSSFRSDDQIKEDPEVHVKSKYPALTPTSSF